MTMSWTTIITVVFVLLMSFRLGQDPNFPPTSIGQGVTMTLKAFLDVFWLSARAIRINLEQLSASLERGASHFASRAVNRRGVMEWDHVSDMFGYNGYNIAKLVVRKPLGFFRGASDVLGAVCSTYRQMARDEQVAYCHSRGGCRDSIIHARRFFNSRWNRPNVFPGFTRPGEEGDAENPAVLICSEQAVYSDVEFLMSFLQQAGIDAEDLVLLEGDDLIGAVYAKRDGDVVDAGKLWEDLHIFEFFGWAHGGTGAEFYSSTDEVNYEVKYGVQRLYQSYVEAVHRAPETDVLFWRMEKYTRLAGVDTSKTHLQPLFLCKLERWFDLEPMADDRSQAVMGDSSAHPERDLSTQQLILAWLVHEGHIGASSAGEILSAAA